VVTGNVYATVPPALRKGLVDRSLADYCSWDGLFLVSLAERAHVSFHKQRLLGPRGHFLIRV